jgi:hypothetical protein
LVLVVNDAAVFHAVTGVTLPSPTDRNRKCCVRWSRYRNSTLTSENASTERTYTLHRMSASGSIPQSL